MVLLSNRLETLSASPALAMSAEGGPYFNVAFACTQRSDDLTAVWGLPRTSTPTYQGGQDSVSHIATIGVEARTIQIVVHNGSTFKREWGYVVATSVIHGAAFGHAHKTLIAVRTSKEVMVRYTCHGRTSPRIQTDLRFINIGTVATKSERGVLLHVVVINRFSTGIRGSSKMSATRIQQWKFTRICILPLPV